MNSLIIWLFFLLCVKIFYFCILYSFVYLCLYLIIYNIYIKYGDRTFFIRNRFSLTVVLFFFSITTFITKLHFFNYITYTFSIINLYTNYITQVINNKQNCYLQYCINLSKSFHQHWLMYQKFMWLMFQLKIQRLNTPLTTVWINCKANIITYCFVLI